MNKWELAGAMLLVAVVVIWVLNQQSGAEGGIGATASVNTNDTGAGAP